MVLIVVMGEEGGNALYASEPDPDGEVGTTVEP